MEAEPLPPPPLIGAVSGSMEDSVRSPLPLINQARVVGAALNNLGNTCFLNAVLQCVTHTVPLVQKLRSAKHPSCSENEGFCSFCALRKHVNDCMLMSGLVVSPTNFAYNLSKISSYLTLGQQEDAHEFLHYLLDRLHTCCLDPSSKDRPSSSEADSLVSQVFGGRLRSQLRCCSCGHCSDTFEPLLDISLEIDDADNLTDALKSFTKIEKIEDSEATFTCEGCKAQVSMEKQLKLDKAPDVVTLHLKRFKNNGLFISKIDKFVEYPLELDLRPFLSCPEDEEQSKYELYAVVVHHGSSYYGHYVCSIRSSPIAWHLMDDSKVERISEAFVLNQTAYILFYVKQGSSPWFSSFMESQELPHPTCGSVDSPISVLDDTAQDPHSSSVGESTSSSSAETAEKDEDPSSCSVASPESAAVKVEVDHVATPPRAPNVTEKVTGNRFMTQTTRRHTSDHVIDVFHDEPVENEENQLIRQANRGSKGSREVARPAFSVNGDSRMNSLGISSLVRGMPSARRAGILGCLASQQAPPHKQTPTARSEPPLNHKRRRRQPWNPEDGRSLGRSAAPDLGPTPRQSLSPRSIRRGLFADDRFEFEFK